MKFGVGDLKYDERGLVPAVVQDASTGDVLTLAYVNRESLSRTLEQGETWFWSRSRGELWHKGETSGNVQRVRQVVADCDGDALVILVEPKGPACHEGSASCFHNEVEGGRLKGRLDASGWPVQRARGLGEVLEELHEVVERRREARPENSYTTYLFEQGLDKILKKVGEEAAETIIAAKNEDRGALVSETSDLLYHLLVLLAERGVTPGEVAAELARRKGRTAEG